MRKGDWVTVGGVAGIVADPGDICEIHLVNDEGETVAIQRVAADELTPAEPEQIPAARRPVSAEEEERISAELLAAAPPPVPGDLAEDG